MSNWTEITNMTQQMLAHARSGEWNSVISLETDRQSKLQTYFSASPKLDEAEWIAKGIMKVMSIDKEIMALGKTDIEKLGEALTQIQRGKQAQFAYKKLA